VLGLDLEALQGPTRELGGLVTTVLAGDPGIAAAFDHRKLTAFVLHEHDVPRRLRLEASQVRRVPLHDEQTQLIGRCVSAAVLTDRRGVGEVSLLTGLSAAAGTCERRCGTDRRESPEAAQGTPRRTVGLTPKSRGDGVGGSEAG